MKCFSLCLFILSSFLVQANQAELDRRLHQAVLLTRDRDKDIEEVNKHIEEVQKLLEAGANPNAKDKKGTPLLHKASHPSINTMLLNAGADPNAEDEKGNTALFFAVSYIFYPGYSKRIDALIEAGANLSARNKEGRTILENTDSFIIPQLIQAGADPNEKGKGGRTPLHRAEYFHEAKFLRENGADPNARDDQGNTPLHSNVNLFEVAEFLVENGADPNAQNNAGETPLHRIYGSHTYEKARMLIKNGANPRIRDKDGNLSDIVTKYPELLTLSPEPDSKKQKISCRYTTESSQITATQCGRKSICMGQVYCVFRVGMGSDRINPYIDRIYPVVCSSLPDGKCPTALDCVLDRSIVEKNTETEETNPSSSPATPKSTKTNKGTR